MEIEIYLKREGKDFGKDSGGLWISAEKKKIRDILKKLKDLGVLRISSITAVDLGKDLEVIYHLIFQNRPINIRIPVGKKTHTIETITDIFPGANLFEREVSEMFGIHIKGHPDPRKLFLGETSPKTPQRRDKNKT